MKNNKILKYTVAVLVSAAVLFGLFNLVWYGFKYLPYSRLASKMQFNGNPDMPRYVYTDGGYLYRLKMPRYLSFDSGFLYVGPDNEDAAMMVVEDDGSLTEKNIPHVDMFIWPQMFSGTQYGIGIYEEAYSMSYMADSSGKYLPDASATDEEKAEAEALFEKHSDEIRDIMRAADKMWGSEL